MNKKYKVVITPLEPYTLGTEQGSKYDKVQTQGRESYIIASSEVPEQTTVLGALRYIVLSHHGKLKSDFRYDDSDKIEMDKLVGPQSFAFAAEAQSFGLIKSVSPVFLTEGVGDNCKYYVKTPFCIKGDASHDGEYQTYPLQTEEILTSKGRMQLPGKAYDSKSGHGHGYICLQDKRIVTDLFTKVLMVGNRADHTSRDNRDGFYKRESVILKKGFSFAVYVDAEDGAFPKTIVAYMGRKKSAFQFEFTEVGEGESIEKMTAVAFADSKEQWYYALSDIYDPLLKTGNAFAIVESKKIRNLETIVTGKDYIAKRKKSVRIGLIKAGSVFKAMPQINENANCKVIGYNTIVVLGGEK